MCKVPFQSNYWYYWVKITACVLKYFYKGEKAVFNLKGGQYEGILVRYVRVERQRPKENIRWHVLYSSWREKRVQAMFRSQVSKMLSNLGEKISNLILLRLKLIITNSFYMELFPTRNITLFVSILLKMCVFPFLCHKVPHRNIACYVCYIKL